MVAPLIPIALMSFGAGANLYSQYKQRQLYKYQMGAYERQLADYYKNVGRPIKYPELSYEGRLRALRTGISQSYASSLASLSSYGYGAYASADNYYRHKPGSKQGTYFTYGKMSGWL